MPEPRRAQPSDQRGFALLMVLWLLAMVSGIAATVLARTSTSLQASRNRIVLTRAEWAREGCVEVLGARWHGGTTAGRQDSRAARRQGGRTAGDTVDLGRGVWCTWELEDPTAKVNLNQADRQVLMTLLASDSLVDAIMDWRDADDLPLEFGAELGWYSAHGRLVPRNGPFAAVEELGLVRGFDSTRLAEARERFTVRGTGAINPNLAPVEILATIPELGPEALEVIRGRRAQDRPLGSLDELLSLLSPAGRAPILARYPELLGRLAFGPAQLVARVTGGVRGYPLTSTAVLTVVPLPDRLAVVRRETE